MYEGELVELDMVIRYYGVDWKDFYAEEWDSDGSECSMALGEYLLYALWMG